MASNQGLTPREARRAERRRRAIRNRLILAGIALLLVIIIILLIIAINKKDGGSASTDTTAAGETTIAPELSDDSTAPIIAGAQDITVYVGDTISYRQGVTVTDDIDPNPTLEIDSSAVNNLVAGTYSAIYTATDAAGNASTVTISVNVLEKSTEVATTSDSGYDAADDRVSYMKYLAGLYLKQIVTDDMSDSEKALRIWLWVNWNCDYVSSSDKSSWVEGAIQYFDTHKGDCFNYFCAAKALLQECGFDTVDIVKSDTSHSAHYWLLLNLGNGYYHFDATPRDGSGDFFFMVTDEQLDAYSEANGNSHIFDHDAYPARATQIITDMNAQPDYYSYFSE